MSYSRKIRTYFPLTLTFLVVTARLTIDVAISSPIDLVPSFIEDRTDKLDTAVARKRKSTGKSIFVNGGKEDEWWKTDDKHDLSTFFIPFSHSTSNIYFGLKRGPLFYDDCVCRVRRGKGGSVSACKPCVSDEVMLRIA